MGLLDTLNFAFQNLKVSGLSKMRATQSQATKTKYIQAFHTITTMLSFLQSPSTQLASESGVIGSTPEHREELRILDALSALLIRQHEITAIVAKPYPGYGILQVFVSAVYPSIAEPSLQPHDKGFWSMFKNFTIAVNPREKKINGCTDSLLNSTSFLLIGDHQDQVPVELVTAANDNAPMLDIFLKSYW